MIFPLRGFSFCFRFTQFYVCGCFVCRYACVTRRGDRSSGTEVPAVWVPGTEPAPSARAVGTQNFCTPAFGKLFSKF